MSLNKSTAPYRARTVPAAWSGRAADRVSCPMADRRISVAPHQRQRSNDLIANAPTVGALFALSVSLKRRVKFTAKGSR